MFSYPICNTVLTLSYNFKIVQPPHLCNNLSLNLDGFWAGLMLMSGPPLQQGVVTHIHPVLPPAIAIKSDFDPVYYGNKPERPCPLVYFSIYYNGSTDQEAKMARSSNHASFCG